MEHSEVLLSSVEPWLNNLSVHDSDERPVWLAPEYMGELVLDCPDVVSDLLRLFLCDAAVRLDILREQALNFDALAITKSLHTLKGSCFQIGAQRLGTLIQDIESCYAAGQCLDVVQLFHPVDEAFASLRTELFNKIYLLEKGMWNYAHTDR